MSDSNGKGGRKDANIPAFLDDQIPGQWRDVCDKISDLEQELIQCRKKRAYLEALAGASGIVLGPEVGIYPTPGNTPSR